MNIAEHIAYLIGDSKRIVIPIYSEDLPDDINDDITDDTDDTIIDPTDPIVVPEDNPVIPTLLSQEKGTGLDYILTPENDEEEGGETEENIILYLKNNANINDIPHPQDITGIIEVNPDGSFGDSARRPYLPYTPGDALNLFDATELPDLIKGKYYKFEYEGDSDLDVSDLYSDKPYTPQSVDYITRYTLEKWLKDSVIKVSKLMPSNLKLHMNKNQSFTAGLWQDNVGTGIGISLDNLGSSDIISVYRFDGEIAYEARLIPFHMRSKARFGSGFLEECSETDPIYYVNDRKIFVEPSPQETNLEAIDGFCSIDFIGYPDLKASDTKMDGIPLDVQQIVLIATAIRCKKYQIDSLAVPVIPVLNSNFSVAKLDNPDIIDAIDKAKQLLDNYDENDFKDFLETEDIDMAQLALQGAKSHLEIASVELSEQDKRAAQYLSEYSQNISKFAQQIARYNSAAKKLSADYSNLQSEYQELIYSLRGQLPNKKQLKRDEQTLAQIKQLVGR